MGFWQFATGGGSGGGTGDVVGPASSTDNAVARWDLATGKLLQNSGLIVSDVAAGAITVTSTAGTAITLKNTDPAATTGASVAGDVLSLTAGNAVASTDTAGAAAGGAVTITAGNAARNTSGNANGGDINLTTGAGIGTGTTGNVVLPSAAQLTISTDTGLARSAAGQIKVTDGSTGYGKLLVRNDGGSSLVGIAFGGTTNSQPALAANGAELWVVGAADPYGQYNNFRASAIKGSVFTTAGAGLYADDNNTTIGSAAGFLWSNGVSAPGTPDTGLSRIAAGQIAAKNVTNGMANNIKIATTTVNASGATSTATNLVPAGCILLGVTTRVTTAITSGDGGTSVDIGNGTDADMYGATIAFTLGTTTDLSNHTASALAFKSAAESVVFTCVGGTFSGGVWRVCAHYLDLTAPTS